MKVSCYSMCHSWYDNEEQAPLLLHCSHGFCKACLSRMFAASTDTSLSCPRHHHPPSSATASMPSVRTFFSCPSSSPPPPSTTISLTSLPSTASLPLLSLPSLPSNFSLGSLSLYLAPPSLLRRRPAGSTEGGGGGRRRGRILVAERGELAPCCQMVAGTLRQTTVRRDMGMAIMFESSIIVRFTTGGVGGKRGGEEGGREEGEGEGGDWAGEREG